MTVQVILRLLNRVDQVSTSLNIFILICRLLLDVRCILDVRSLCDVSDHHERWEEKTASSQNTESLAHSETMNLFNATWPLS